MDRVFNEGDDAYYIDVNNTRKWSMIRGRIGYPLLKNYEMENGDIVNERHIYYAHRNITSETRQDMETAHKIDNREFHEFYDD